MSHSQRFLDLLQSHGFDFFTGVPCSLFEGVTRILDECVLRTTAGPTNLPPASAVR